MSLTKYKIVKLITILSLILTLAGCGFHLRKVEALPKNLNVVYLQTKQSNSQFIQALIRLLHANKINFASNIHQAKLILRIISIKQDNRLNSLTGSAEAGLYSITESVKFMVLSNKGKTLLAPTTVQTKRYYNSNATQILSSNAKTEQLVRSMRNQLSQLLLEQLVKTPSFKTYKP